MPKQRKAQPQESKLATAQRNLRVRRMLTKKLRNLRGSQVGAPRGDAAVAAFRRRARQAAPAVPREIISSEPTARQASLYVGAPQFNSSRPLVVCHREYLQQIISVTAFTGAGPYVLQPGLSDNFPWLANIAQNFEQYRFRKLRYIYRNRSPTSTGGTIYAATQYDPSDVAFTSVEQIMNYAGARSEVVWRDFQIDTMLQRGSILSKYFVRTDALPAGLDPQTFDYGLFTICGVASSAGLVLGDLLVEYEVELFNPRQNQAILGAFGMGGYPNGVDAASLAATPLQGFAASYSGNFSTSNKPVVDETKSTITFPQQGAYDVSWSVDRAAGSSLTFSALVVASYTLGMILTIRKATSSSSSGVLWIKVLTTAANQYLQLSAGTTGGPGGWVSSLAIAVEASDWMLNWLGYTPYPPLLDPIAYAYAKSNSRKSEGWRRLAAHYEAGHKRDMDEYPCHVIVPEDSFLEKKENKRSKSRA